jgi:hypothetical protein
MPVVRPQNQIHGLTAVAAKCRACGQLQASSIQRYVPPFLIALIYVGLGDEDQAFAWLAKAYAERSVWMPWLKVDPEFDDLRSDPRFVSLMQRIGFTT